MSVSTNFRKLVPLMNRVLVKKADPVKASKSGIIMSSKDEIPNVGTIVSVGAGQWNESGQRMPLDVAVGNRVLLPEFGGVRVELGEGEFYLFRDTELLGVLEEPVQ